MAHSEQPADCYCIIGAGPSGLAVLKNFREAAIHAESLEREDGVGGNWYYGRPSSSVYRSTHLVSSKSLTQYPDFPMPADWPEYPSQQQVQEYLRAYAKQFRLHEAIRFNTSVQQVEPADATASRWIVTLSTGERRCYRGVVIANGHHWDPNWPSYPGCFDGAVLHSSQYKTPEVLTAKRTLVVGGGNSGCDIAVESAQCATATFHSMRRGYHFVPKFIRGIPADRCGEFLLRWRVPLWLRRRLAARAIRIAIGPLEEYGLPPPDHQLFESHPIVNSQMTYFAGHGRIKPKPDVAELCGERVRFIDGSIEPIDLIVYATGFKLSFPFIDREHLNWQYGKPQLFLNVFHPRYDNLFVAGMIQPDSGIWGLVHYQAQLIAQFIQLQQRQEGRADKFRQLKSRFDVDLAGGIHYLHTPRHALEVEHYSYRCRLQRLLAAFTT
ncbi:MAG: NAD(P)-binding domain-containing protein [Pirellulales bacterium]|nr:NAD(P)-binding domain-containing protein [Pirellulales bacterium]